MKKSTMSSNACGVTAPSASALMLSLLMALPVSAQVVRLPGTGTGEPIGGGPTQGAGSLITAPTPPPPSLPAAAPPPAPMVAPALTPVAAPTPISTPAPPPKSPPGGRPPQGNPTVDTSLAAPIPLTGTIAAPAPPPQGTGPSVLISVHPKPTPQGAGGEMAGAAVTSANSGRPPNGLGEVLPGANALSASMQLCPCRAWRHAARRIMCGGDVTP
jgi:hypothetical protein